MKNWIWKLHFSSASIPLAYTKYRQSLYEYYVIRMLKYVICGNLKIRDENAAFTGLSKAENRSR